MNTPAVARLAALCLQSNRADWESAASRQVLSRAEAER
jgi:hypothetical protein